MRWAAVLVVLVAVLSATAHAGVLPTTGTMFAAVYGASTWAIGGNNGTVFVSDATAHTWTRKPIRDFQSIIYGGAFCEDTKTFVFVGANMGIVTSTDLGVTWTVTNPPKTGTADLKSIACVNSTFVAVTKGGNTLQSADGVQWQITTVGVSGQTWTVRNLDGWYYIGGTNQLFVSPTGASFARKQVGSGSMPVYVFDIAAIGSATWDTTYCLAAGGSISTATTDFTRLQPQAVFRDGNNFLGVAAWNRKFAVASTAGVFLSDTSLAAFKNVFQSGRFWGIAAGGPSSTLVVVGDSAGSSVVYSTTDGVTWV